MLLFAIFASEAFSWTSRFAMLTIVSSTPSFDLRWKTQFFISAKVIKLSLGSVLNVLDHLWLPKLQLFNRQSYKALVYILSTFLFTNNLVRFVFLDLEEHERLQGFVFTYYSVRIETLFILHLTTNETTTLKSKRILKTSVIKSELLVHYGFGKNFFCVYFAVCFLKMKPKIFVRLKSLT